MRLAACIFIALLPACKFGTTQSSVQESQPRRATMMLVHGKLIPANRVQEIIVAIGGSSSGSPSSITGSNSSILALTGETSAQRSTKKFSLLETPTYIETCGSNGVPIPPPWIDPSDTSKINPKWSKIAELPSSRIFALDPLLETTLYAYTDDKGTCAALPRGPKGSHATNVEALGMICQGTNGKSCFWDNKTPAIMTDSNGDPFQERIAQIIDIKPENMANANNLVENCSQCHRGDNIFIIHEDTDMVNLPGSIPNQKAEPISSQNGWDNRPGSSKIAPTCQNGDCHNSLPEFNFSYCSTVLMPSLKSFRWEKDEFGQLQQVDIHKGKGAPMPPKDKVNVADYDADIKQIEQECQQIYSRERVSWEW